MVKVGTEEILRKEFLANSASANKELRMEEDYKEKL